MNDQFEINEPDPAKPRRRLFWKYAFMFGVLVSCALVISGIVEFYFSYQETKTALLRIQREKAQATSLVIERFINEIESQIGWTTHTGFLTGDEAMAQRRIDYYRLLRQAPAITEIAYLDGSGKEKILVSRIKIDTVNSGKDFANDPKFSKTVEVGRYLSPVYFLRESEPYLTLGLAGKGRDRGINVAEVNLKFIWDVVSRIRVGQRGKAFVVDSRGLLIAHPDISLVLRKTDVSDLPQVIAAIRRSSTVAPDDLGMITRSVEGREVLSSHAPIKALDWLVFVETPLSEAFAPLYSSLIRTLILIILGIGIAVLTGFALASRVVKPIVALQEGAASIGAGALDHRIRINTGDELEALAREFNRMTANLKNSYDNIERMSQLKRYFSPQLADHIISSDGVGLMESHRREIAVLFCDLRNFTGFSSEAEPKVVMQVLGQYFKVLGGTIRTYEATIGHFSGDGLMAFFNDPIPCPDPSVQAVRMAIDMRADVGSLIEEWNSRNINLGFGIGISSGFATLGNIGSEEQFHYTVIGSVVNLASRLCDEAQDGQILISKTVADDVRNIVDLKTVGQRSLKGFSDPHSIFSVTNLVNATSAV